MGLTVSEKSVFPTSFARGRFEGNLFSFENISDYRKSYLTSYVCRYLIMTSFSS